MNSSIHFGCNIALGSFRPVSLAAAALDAASAPAQSRETPRHGPPLHASRRGYAVPIIELCRRFRQLFFISCRRAQAVRARGAAGAEGAYAVARYGASSRARTWAGMFGPTLCFAGLYAVPMTELRRLRTLRTSSTARRLDQHVQRPENRETALRRRCAGERAVPGV